MRRQLYCLEHGIQVNMHSRFVDAAPLDIDCPNATPQPDGYLTEERKAQEPDQGFSTFFSETGTRLRIFRANKPPARTV